MKSCDICKVICDGKNTIKSTIHDPLTVCDNCLNDYANHEWDNLTKKMEKVRTDKVNSMEFLINKRRIKK